MAEACKVASTLQNKDANISAAEEMLVETQANKSDPQSVSSSNIPIDEDSPSDTPLEENEVMASLLARLDAIQQLNPANE